MAIKKAYLSIDQIAARFPGRPQEQIEAVVAHLGGKIQEGDLNTVSQALEMLDADSKIVPAQPQGRAKSTGSIAKTDRPNLTQSGKSLIPVDPNNLPQVSSLTSGEVTQWIERIEQSKADGEAQDGRLIQFLSDLYNHRQQAIELGRGAIAALTQQDQELSKVMGDLSSTVSQSLRGLNQADTQLSEIAGGAARLGDSFRRRSDLLGRFHAAIGTNSAQSAPEAESAA